jgi:hypothetical protein
MVTQFDTADKGFRPMVDFEAVSAMGEVLRHWLPRLSPLDSFNYVSRKT